MQGEAKSHRKRKEEKQIMSNRLVIPQNYDPMLDQIETQRAIKKIKDYFQQELAYGLQLRRVSAPLVFSLKQGLTIT